jgi:hypothetical protein
MRIKMPMIAAICGLALVVEPAYSYPQSFIANVASVYPQGDGSVILTFTQDSQSCSASGNPKYFTVMSGQNGVASDGVKNILATALTALALGKPVSVVFDDATPSCYINRIAVQGP